MGQEEEALRALIAELRSKLDLAERTLADLKVTELPYPNRPDRTVVLTKEQREQVRADVNMLIAEVVVKSPELKPIATTEAVADPILPAPIEPTPIEPV